MSGFGGGVDESGCAGGGGGVGEIVSFGEEGDAVPWVVGWEEEVVDCACAQASRVY